MRQCENCKILCLALLILAFLAHNWFLSTESIKLLNKMRERNLSLGWSMNDTENSFMSNSSASISSIFPSTSSPLPVMTLAKTVHGSLVEKLPLPPVDFQTQHQLKLADSSTPSNSPTPWVNFSLTASSSSSSGVGNMNETQFTVIVLSMDRVMAFQRLLKSLEVAEYNGDKVHLVIKVDYSVKNRHVVDYARSFEFSHGPKTVEVASNHMGLRESWFNAWMPRDIDAHSIVLEDDVELSSKWYIWLKEAWKKYGHRDDLAGISLQRQTLIPQKPTVMREIVNGHEVFLYPLLGSIGFSPHPKHWIAFMNWIGSINVDTFDVFVPGLVTSDWWKIVNKRSMWTQHFIYFCIKHSLYTMYINLPKGETLCAHHREKGEHYGASVGRDFPLAKDVALKFQEVSCCYSF